MLSLHIFYNINTNHFLLYTLLHSSNNNCCGIKHVLCYSAYSSKHISDIHLPIDPFQAYTIILTSMQGRLLKAEILEMNVQIPISVLFLSSTYLWSHPQLVTAVRHGRSLPPLCSARNRRWSTRRLAHSRWRAAHQGVVMATLVSYLCEKMRLYLLLTITTISNHSP